MTVRVGIGQDSHAFLPKEEYKPCILGGILFAEARGLKANSDGDVVLHALCNAITSLTHTLILGGLADELLQKKGITDSTIYVEHAMASLGAQKITHVAITIEAKEPYIFPRREEMRTKIASLLHLRVEQVGVTATTGEGLTSVGRGEGISVFCIVTTTE